MKKVVVFDEDEDILNVVYIILKQFGSTPLLTSQPNEIIPLLNREKPQAVILDISKEPKALKEFCYGLKQNTPHKECVPYNF